MTDNLFQLSMYGLRARHKSALKTSVFALMSDYSYYTLYFDIKANKIAKKSSPMFAKVQQHRT